MKKINKKSHFLEYNNNNNLQFIPSTKKKKVIIIPYLHYLINKIVLKIHLLLENMGKVNLVNLKIIKIF